MRGYDRRPRLPRRQRESQRPRLLDSKDHRVRRSKQEAPRRRPRSMLPRSRSPGCLTRQCRQQKFAPPARCPLPALGARRPAGLLEPQNRRTRRRPAPRLGLRENRDRFQVCVEQMGRSRQRQRRRRRLVVLLVEENGYRACLRLRSRARRRWLTGTRSKTCQEVSEGV